MDVYKSFSVKLKEETYVFYNEIAKFLERPVEEILSDMLYKYADIVMEEAKPKRDQDQQAPDFPS